MASDADIKQTMDALALRFTSGNAVPVERATITRTEYNALLALYDAVMALREMSRPELHEIEGDMEDYALNDGRAMGWNECRAELRRLMPDCGSGE